VSNRQWGRLYNDLAASSAGERLAFGIDAGTAVEFGPGLATPLVVGDGVAVALDGRFGSFAVGSNGARLPPAGCSSIPSLVVRPSLRSAGDPRHGWLCCNASR
jgi:hypothetical protein